MQHGHPTVAKDLELMCSMEQGSHSNKDMTKKCFTIGGERILGFFTGIRNQRGSS